MVSRLDVIWITIAGQGTADCSINLPKGVGPGRHAVPPEWTAVTDRDRTVVRVSQIQRAWRRAEPDGLRQRGTLCPAAGRRLFRVSGATRQGEAVGQDKGGTIRDRGRQSRRGVLREGHDRALRGAPGPYTCVEGNRGEGNRQLQARASIHGGQCPDARRLPRGDRPGRRRGRHHVSRGSPGFPGRTPWPALAPTSKRSTGPLQARSSSPTGH